MKTILAAVFTSHMSYHSWATREMLDTVQSLTPEAMQKPFGTSFGSLRGTLHHMFAADRLWVGRLNEESCLTLGGIPVPDRIDVLAAEWVLMLEQVRVRTVDLDSERLSELREFVNSQGIRFTMPVWQMLLHMVNHGTGHRGQVTAIVRQLGFTPRGIVPIYLPQEAYNLRTAGGLYSDLGDFVSSCL